VRGVVSGASSVGIGTVAVEFVLEEIRAKEAAPEAVVERVVWGDGGCECADCTEDVLGGTVVL